MAKTKQSHKMSDFRERILSQASTAHIEEMQPTPTELEEKAAAIQADAAQTATKKKAAATASEPQRKRRSMWENPYPDAKPHQTTFYQCDEDAMLVKQIRLKLRYSKEWMVYKYALEKLAKELNIK